MSQLRRLRDSAAGYLRDQLAQGNTLSRALLACDLSAGELWTYAPGTTDDERLHRLDAGGLTAPTARRPVTASGPIMVPVENLGMPAVSGLVATYLGRRPAAHCVVEDATRKRGDPITIPDLGDTQRFFADEVYYVLTGNDADKTTIERVFRIATSYVFLAALASLSDRADLEARELSAEALRAVGDATDVIIASAYDREGFVIWAKAGERLLAAEA